MTDRRIDHRAEAAHATIRVLLAIHDALTAADRYAANEAKQREAEADPLDEDNHDDRLDRHGRRWRRSVGWWVAPFCSRLATVASLNDYLGPVTFAPDADGAPSATAPAADDPAGDAVDGEEGERRYLNAQTGSGDHEQQEH